MREPSYKKRNTAAKPTVTRTYAYNGRSELVKETTGNGNLHAYAYDNIGNRITAQNNATATSYETNLVNQYSSIATQGQGAFTPSYDAAGNQTLIRTATGEWNVQYNADNRPASFTQGHFESEHFVSCVYDYMGRRIEKTTSGYSGLTKRLRYIYHGYVQIAEIDTTDETAPFVTKTYRWDPSEPVATRPLALSLWTREGTVRETLYYAHDLRKNVVSLFDAKGLRRASYQYDPFGNITSMEGDMAKENPYRFSSEHHDEDLGLVYYNYRHYNPTDGRWISRDPIAERGGYHLYAFVANNAVRFADQLGLSTDTNSVVITVDRHSVIKNVGVYSIITVQLPKISLSKSDKDCKLCSRFSGKKLTFYGIESYEAWRRYHFARKTQGPGPTFTFNHLDPNKTHTGMLREENGDLNNVETTPNGGYTCIDGRVRRPEDQGYHLKLPDRPNCMSKSTYRTIYESEISLGDGGINIHAGETADRHSTGCIIIGTSFAGDGFKYQESLQNDFVLKTAIYCARRVKKGTIKTRANDITEQIDSIEKLDLYPDIVNTIPDFTI